MLVAFICLSFPFAAYSESLFSKMRDSEKKAMGLENVTEEQFQQIESWIEFQHSSEKISRKKK